MNTQMGRAWGSRWERWTHSFPITAKPDGEQPGGKGQHQLQLILCTGLYVFVSRVDTTPAMYNQRHRAAVLSTGSALDTDTAAIGAGRAAVPSAGTSRYAVSDAMQRDDGRKHECCGVQCRCCCRPLREGLAASI